jgi:hypothetical protein
LIVQRVFALLLQACVSYFNQINVRPLLILSLYHTPLLFSSLQCITLYYSQFNVTDYLIKVILITQTTTSATIMILMSFLYPTLKGSCNAKSL